MSKEHVTKQRNRRGHAETLERIEKESLLMYGKMAFTPGKHNDILDIAEELNTKTIKK